MVVADSDVLIDALDAGKEPMATHVAGLIDRGELTTTAVSFFELLAGPRTSVDRLELLQAELGPVEVLPVTRGAADLAAAVARYLGRTGQPIPFPDLLIAGVCLAAGLPLLTRNAAHFRRIPGLVLAPLPH